MLSVAIWLRSFLFLVGISIIMSTTQASERSVMAGGYREVENLQDARLLDVANFAVQELLTLSSSASSSETESNPSYSFLESAVKNKDMLKIQVARAYQQVVAGMNYRMVVVLTTTRLSTSSSSAVAASDFVGAFAVTVYDRFGTLQVTTWGMELSYDKAKALLENEKEFYESSHSDVNGEG